MSELIKTVENATKCFYDKSQRLCLNNKSSGTRCSKNNIKQKLTERRKMLAFVRDSEII